MYWIWTANTVWPRSAEIRCQCLSALCPFKKFWRACSSSHAEQRAIYQCTPGEKFRKWRRQIHLKDPGAGGEGRGHVGLEGLLLCSFCTATNCHQQETWPVSSYRSSTSWDRLSFGEFLVWFGAKIVTTILIELNSSCFSVTVTDRVTPVYCTLGLNVLKT